MGNSRRRGVAARSAAAAVAEVRADQMPWFAVRVLLLVPAGPHVGRFEERITVWQCADASTAMQRAEGEAATQAAATGREVVSGFAQSYELYDPPGHGTEGFSLMRASVLPPGDYVDRFFPARARGAAAVGDGAATARPSWFAVRLLIRFEPEATSVGAQLYEEWVTLWRCDDETDAKRLAHNDAAAYVDPPSGEIVNSYAEVFAMPTTPAGGAVVFSATRDSELSPDEYVDCFHSTGAERTRSVEE